MKEFIRLNIFYFIVYGHCNQLVEPGKLIFEGGGRIKGGKYGFTNFGESTTDFGMPLADFSAPKRFIGMNEKQMYYQMLREGLTVRDLFRQIASKEKVVAKYAYPKYGGYTADTCGYYNPNQRVILDNNTNPQTSSTGDNHGGPAEVWIDNVRTSHISNLMGAQPEVLSRKKYNCKKSFCRYKWYWIAFRADQTKTPREPNGPTVQIWVQCALIKGNGKDPISVRPTGIFLNDPRAVGTENANIPVNKKNAAIFINKSEIEIKA